MKPKRTGGGRSGGGPTLADVAAALQVSKATVSNAYNRPDQLSVQLRDRILAEAVRLGYRGPDPIAATFSRRRVGAIGLIFDDPLTFALTDPAEVLFTTGIGEVCERAGVGLVLIPQGSGVDLVQRALVDGFVCHCDVDGDSRVDAAIGRGLPTVVVDGPLRPDAGHIGINDRTAAREAVRHLVELGHRRIAVLASPLRPDGRGGRAGPDRQEAALHHVMRERLAGYRAGLEAGDTDWAGVPVAECAPYGRESAYSAAVELLDSSDRPTALVAASDELAIGALQAARELGLIVPSQLSIVGFDDAPPAAWTSPGLTTVRQPHHDKGRLAAEHLLATPTQEHTAVMLQAELIVRGSSAPP